MYERSSRCHTAPLLALTVLLSASAVRAEDVTLSRIAFGSCAKQDRPQPIWDAVVAAEPQVFLFIGDNIYGDSRDMAALKAKWDLLGAQPGYRKLKVAAPVLAVWDDHDYGENDAGADFPMRRQSQKVFLDFFEEPADSPRRQRDGLYFARTFGPPGRRVQVILLDTRFFRGPLARQKWESEPGSGLHGVFVPTDDPQSTVLGAAQWEWLEAQLKQPADVRIIASSIQVVADQHGWEKWGNFPHERRRLFELIRKTRAEGVVLVSGDRHHAEISRLPADLVGYPLHDVTSSSLNAPSQWRNELNDNRLGVIYSGENFGMVLIDWQQPDPLVRLQIRDITGEVVLQTKFPLSDLRFGERDGE
jgi:alkaline phosphatase D